ncbi:MAG: DUF4174 domain-containing protein [Bacteroidota bacterium]
MYHWTIGVLILLGVAFAHGHAQDLRAHRWENRVVLLVGEEVRAGSSTALPAEWAEQLRELAGDPAGLVERKLVVYQVTPQGYRRGLETDGGWRGKADLYWKYSRWRTPFQVLLIGLDGGVKLRQTEVLPRAELFARIDGMPMRKAELQRRGE